MTLTDNLRRETIPVQGLDCPDCVRTLENAIGRLEGVRQVTINLASSTLSIEYDTERLDRSTIQSRLRALGYEMPETALSQEATFRVEGLDCADCAVHLEEALRRLPGVIEVGVDFSTARLRLTSDAGVQVHPEVERVVTRMGYSLRPETDSTPTEGKSRWLERVWRKRRDLTTVASGMLIAVAVGMRWLGGSEAAVAAAYVAAILVGGFYIARAGWTAVRTARSLDMNALMTIAAAGSIVIGEWTEGAVAMFLFSLGNTLEGYTLDRTRNAIRKLMDLSPRVATVIRGDREEQAPVEELRVGDHILVHPGERVPMDGIIVAGQSAVNQAPITGESIPVEKAPGDEVLAGTINGLGALTVRVTRLVADTTMARIIRLVEEAQAQKAPAQRFVDRFARVYTPLVIATAAGVAILPPSIGWWTGAGSFTALLGEWFYRALVLLVIACPCALVISTPVTIVSAIASAARNGVLIKGGVHLEALGSLKVIAFDKTGTLTVGRPQVVEMRCVNHSDGRSWASCPGCQQMLRDAAAVERHSEHPLAVAVVQAAEAQGLVPGFAGAEAVEAVPGQGIRGRVNGHTITVGTHQYIHQRYPELVEGPLCEAVHAAQAAGRTAMVVLDDCCGVRGYIGVADTLRPGVPAVMDALARIGIRQTVMLTGDHPTAAQAIARAAGVQVVQAELLPEQKVAAIEALLREHQAVAMVGDGVNDAPALARSTVGIAMGVAGNDTALETADVALMSDDLSKLPFVVKLSRKARAVIRQNVALSLAIKALFLALAVTGSATLWMAVFADMGTSLLVTFNGMRLLRQR